MSISTIFIVIGAPAVGKSTAARALAARLSKSLHIPVDSLRDMVVSGLTHPGRWTEALVEQLALARASACHMARSYSAAGFGVVVDDFWDPHSGLSEYQPLFDDLPVRKVLLYPGRDIALARSLKRSGGGAEHTYISAGIDSVYDSLAETLPQLKQQDWRVLDTSDLTVDETVARILADVEGN